MKKLLCVLLMLFCMTAVFAQQGGFFSLGGGGALTAGFTTWSLDQDIPGNLHRYDTSQLAAGPFIFIDMKFLEISAGFPLGTLNADETMSGDPNFPAQIYSFRGGAYLKLPITISSMFVIFPLAGIDYDLFILARKDDERDAKFPTSAGTDTGAMEALSTLWFKAGVGLDTFFNNHLFLRTELLYGLRLPNEMEKYLNDSRTGVNWMLPHGGDFKVAVGYRF